MGASIRLGRFLGIPLGIHYSWFIIFLVVTFSLSRQLDDLYSLWSAPEKWLVALATSLLFFLSVLVHELSHSLVAVRRGIPVKGITLHIFGGVSQIAREGRSSSTEFIVAAVGPFSSFILGLLFWGLAFGLRGISEHLAAMAFILAPANIALGVFNMLPGFPLDGGRVLRAVIWGVTKNYWQATRIATFGGQGVAFLMVAAGIFIAVKGDIAQGIWLALIGWFVWVFASASYRQLRLREGLHGYKARDLMSLECPVVSWNITLGQLLTQQVQYQNHQLFVVIRDGKVQGIITPQTIKRAPKDSWHSTLVETVLMPTDKALTFGPEEDAYVVLELMDEHEACFAPVIQDGSLLGVISRDSVIRFMRARRK